MNQISRALVRIEVEKTERRSSQQWVRSRGPVVCALRILLFVALLFARNGRVLAADEPLATPVDSTSAVEGITPARGENDATRQHLLAVWEGYQSEVATAEIDYLSIIFTLQSRQLCCDQFEEELRSLSLTPDDGLTRRLMEKFCPEQLTGDDQKEKALLNAVGDWRTFRHQGNDRRCVSQKFEHVMLDDLHLLVDHPNQGVRAYRRGAGQYWFETMDWFRVVPNAPLLADASVRENDDETLRLEYVGPLRPGETEKHVSWLTIGREDGLPRAWKMHSPQTGQLLRMESFQELTMYPGDVLCPAIRMKVNFKDEYVTTVRMSVIRSAKFNQPLQEDAFVLTAPVNWAWFDWRLEKHAGGRWTQPVANVAAFFRARASHPVQESVIGPSTGTRVSWRSVLLMLNGAVLVTVGIALWRRSV